MSQLSIMTLLYRLGEFAERVAWWAYDRSSRLREEQIRRMAVDKVRSPGLAYGFERTSPRLPAPDAAWAEEALEAHLELREALAALAEPAKARTATARDSNLHPIRPAALSMPPKDAEAQTERTVPAEKPRRVALG